MSEALVVCEHGVKYPPGCETCQNERKQFFMVQHKPALILQRKIASGPLRECRVSDWQEVLDEAGNPIPFSPEALSAALRKNPALADSIFATAEKHGVAYDAPRPFTDDAGWHAVSLPK